MSSQTAQTYIYDHGWHAERQRLSLLETLRDPGSIECLERAGVAAGWSCLEVGAGQGSIARWLGYRMGPTGSVLAIDLETDLLEDLGVPNVEVRRADVLDVDLPSGSFDLIHARLVLTHIPERTRAIRRMASWLAPGGRLVLEEVDFFGYTTTDPSWTALVRAMVKATTSRLDWACGRELVPELSAAGLDEVDAHVEVDVIHGATPIAEWYTLTMRAMRDALVGAGMGTDEELEEQLARLQDPSFRALGLALVRAWGRRAD
jgi:SAM-dependent methyltransferase